MKQISNKKNYFLSVFSSFGSQIISMGVGLLSVPLSLNYWGVERFGLWAIINSIIVYIGISNLGLGNAASTLIAKNNNVRDKLLILKRATLMLLLSVSMFGGVFFILQSVTDKWVYFIGDIPTQYFTEVTNAILFMVFFFLLHSIFALIDSVLIGFQMMYVNKYFDVFSTFALFSGLLITIFVNGSLAVYVLITGVIKLFVYVLKIIYFYIVVYKKIDFSKEVLSFDNPETKYKTIFITGIRFFSIGIAAMVVWNTDNLVISHFLGVQYVTPYSITFRVFSILFSILFVMNGSVLPLLARGIGNKDWNWINHVYNKLLVLITIFGGALWIGGILFFKEFIVLWTGMKGYAGIGVVFFLGGYAYLLSMVNLNASVVNTFNYIKKTVWIGWLEAGVNFSASLFFLQYFGLAGVALGTFLGSLVGPTILLPFVLIKKSNKQLKYNFNFVITHFIYILFPIVVASVLIQVFIINIFLKIAIGIILFGLYVIACYNKLPSDVKNYLFSLLKEFVEKIFLFFNKRKKLTNMVEL